MGQSNKRSISDIVAMLDRMKAREEARKEVIRNCKHDWKSDFDFVYDYDHQTCTKCGHKRMV